MTLGGRYRVERELGRGGMAKVFLGTDTVLGRPVAVKVLAPQFVDDEGFVQRFRREAQAAASIQHPHIVSVFDTGSDDGVHFIVMEYVEGRTLAEILAGGGRILPDRAIDIAMDACRALEAAHARGVIHRDIKPGNIMLDARGDVKVTDFGIARVTTTADTVAQTAAILGTASYLSPEQAQGQPVDGRSDIYSLACVVYEMVTGRPPFLGDSPVAVASKQVLEQPTPPSRLNPDVTADLDAVILRGLAKNPANRYQSAEEMRADLERAKRGLPVDATPLLAAGTTQVLAPPPAHATEVLPPPEPERGTNWVPIVVTLVLIGLLGALLWFLAANVLNDEDGQTGVLVTVPDVVGEKRSQAISDLEEAGLEVGTITPVPAADDTQEPGTVLEQDPAAGDEVERGTPVDLTIVAAPDLVPIPDLEGASLEEAQSTLIGLGLEPGGPVEEPSDTVDEGDVTRTDPATGTEVEPGSTVTIFVSSGPDLVVVPEVRCQSFGSAQNELDKAGLGSVISSDTVAVNPACPLGNKVAAQDPAPGEEVEPGSTVTLFQGAEGPTGPTGATP
ncbi:MAG TPA: Stk1 family PASTA domain-containing Ser/Thr kinase [Actinomycetota bacterium]|nr:Stk1 family PASTA domain-containing Ser/Thr kinase [Actinomycetota bacterium]